VSTLRLGCDPASVAPSERQDDHTPTDSECHRPSAGLVSEALESPLSHTRPADVPGCGQAPVGVRGRKPWSGAVSSGLGGRTWTPLDPLFHLAELHRDLARALSRSRRPWPRPSRAPAPRSCRREPSLGCSNAPVTRSTGLLLGDAELERDASSGGRDLDGWAGSPNPPELTVAGSSPRARGRGSSPNCLARTWPAPPPDDQALGVSRMPGGVSVQTLTRRTAAGRGLDVPGGTLTSQPISPANSARVTMLATGSVGAVSVHRFAPAFALISWS
jgi:hypothetical protein